MASKLIPVLVLVIILLLQQPTDAQTAITRAPSCPMNAPASTTACNCNPSAPIGELCVNGGLCRANMQDEFVCVCPVTGGAPNCAETTPLACSSDSQCTTMPGGAGPNFICATIGDTANRICVCAPGHTINAAGDCIPAVAPQPAIPSGPATVVVGDLITITCTVGNRPENEAAVVPANRASSGFSFQGNPRFSGDDIGNSARIEFTVLSGNQFCVDCNAENFIASTTTQICVAITDNQDECAMGLDNCIAPRVCVNTVGSFICCTPGMIDNGFGVCTCPAGMVPDGLGGCTAATSDSDSAESDDSASVASSAGSASSPESADSTG